MEAYGVYRGRHIIGLGVPRAVVAAGEHPDERVYVEQYLLLKNKPLKSLRVSFPKGIFAGADELLEDGLEWVRAEIEGAWLGLPEEKRSRDDLRDPELRKVSRVRVLWIKRDHPGELEEVKSNTLCGSLKEDLERLLPLEFDCGPV